MLIGGAAVTEARFAAREPVAAIGLDSMRAPRVSAADMAKTGSAEQPVIGVIPGKIITDHLRRTLPLQGDMVLPDATQDVAKVVVVARHGHNRNIARGFVHGFGLASGAIASSVGHDSHNICAVGMDDDDLACAVNRLSEIGGGFVVASGGAVRAEIALPIAGLMSTLAHEELSPLLHALREAARGLGCRLAEPFLQVAFLPLPVIPHLKITDRGMVDVDRMAFVD